MALGIRGANPIWSEVDLQGNLFDDTFWMFVLQNTIPYAPARVYHDPDLNTEWDNPIQFLGNGTLPNNIYFESEVVYRLEFRQHVGAGMPTQADPLIYEVNNYVAGAGGSTPVDTLAFASSNQITNPQFALINFGTPASPTYTFTGTDPDPIHLAPGWFLDLAGTGTVTMTQVPLDNSNSNPSNAPYALRLTLNGWTNDSVFLRQRFEQNGMLWANKFVSSTVTARLEGSPQNISANLVSSQPATLTTVLTSTPVNEAWNEFTDYGELPATTNPNDPPAAYIEYKLALPSNIDIYLTSFQLVVQDLPIKPSFEQDSINRQIDHTYNTAYPIVPVGTVIDFGGFDVPDHYLFCDGAAVSRTTYNLLFQAITATETVTLTASSATFTVASGARYRIGMGLQNAAIPANTTIIGISTNTITMSSPATVTGATSVRFFAAARTYSETVTLTSTVSTFTVVSAANYGIGMAVTGTGIPSATVITNIVGTTITISHAATITGSSVVTFYSPGYGDGTTTFNVYNLQDFVVAGAGPGGSLFGTGTSGLGAKVGSATHTMTQTELASHTHTGTVPFNTIGGTPPPNVHAVRYESSSPPIYGVFLNTRALSIDATGDNTPFSIVQQTALLNKCIRFE